MLSKNPSLDRSNAIDAADVLNDLLSDFITGTMIFRNGKAQLLSGNLSLVNMADLQRMCVSTLALAFSKYGEFYKHYHQLIPSSRRKVCKDLLKDIKTREIDTFRDRVIGHIWAKEHGRPLKHSEVMQMLDAMVKSDFNSFLDWINNPNNNIYPATVVSIVETLRDEIAKEYSIQPEEIVNR